MTHKTESSETMKILMNESDTAFSILMGSGGVTNTDFADFTSNNFISSFRHVLQKPDLSRAQLASMLRNAERRKKRRDNDTNWPSFMAGVVASGANSNENIAIN